MKKEYSEIESERMRLACGVQQDDWQLVRQFKAYDEVMLASETGGKRAVMEVLKRLANFATIMRKTDLSPE